MAPIEVLHFQGFENLNEKSMIRVRMSEKDAHYAGKLCAGAKMMELFGDIATELAIKHDGDEGLLAGYESVEFLAPVYAGDFIEATGEIVKVGKTSRTIEFMAYKVATGAGIRDSPSSFDFLDQPVLVARAKGTTVVRKELQRKSR